MEKNNETTEVFNFKDREAWWNAIDSAPRSSWIEERSLGTKKSKYLPIAIQQALADKFFAEADVFDEHYQVIANEILCTVKISVLPSYPNAEPRVISGTGVKPIQCDSGAQPHRFPRLKKTNALEYNAPAARSAAIGNALQTFSNIFGRNLGRAVSTNFSFSEKKTPKKKTKKTKK